MSNHNSQSPPDDDYFNDLSRQLPSANTGDQQDANNSNDDDVAPNGQIPKTKRIACVLCRKRKLKCDGSKPACGTCARLQHDCSYDEVRRKSGPKRGYVKALEARLAQVETLLKTQDEPVPPLPSGLRQGDKNIHGGLNGKGQIPSKDTSTIIPGFPDFSNGDGAIPMGDINQSAEDSFPWEMIGLGLDEPLPSQEVVDELNQVYFEKIHHSLSMIHRPRFYAAMNLPPHMRPPICLRYAMWALACSVSDKYDGMQEHFYSRARKYIQQDEMRGHGEGMITVAHCQAWVLLCMYEFKNMYFPRAWMSAGRAVRHAQMMGLHRLDGTGLDVKQCLPPPKDFTEREERRRTFWSAFCCDRYSSIGTGWPMTIDERDILTSLPVEEDAYVAGRASPTMTLEEAFELGRASQISSFGGTCLMASLFGRNLTHLHRPTPGDVETDLNGEFWKRHRTMDNILLNIALSLPERLRLPAGLNKPNIIFLNMCVHTSTICLHQAAIFKADKGGMPARVSAESKLRCITAAAETASIMRQASHLDLTALNPFISFSLYVAARVFVQYLKSRPKDEQIRSSLQFLLSAMHAIKRKNPLTESFLVQLDVDLEGAGLEDSTILRNSVPKSSIPNRSGGCPTEHIGFDSIKRAPTYGDNGLATFTEPNDPGFLHTTPSSHSNQSDPFGGYNVTDMNDFMGNANSNNASSPQFDLPTRQRTPGFYRSPQSGQNLDNMGLSPDDSNTNGSISQPNGYSSHTSNAGYSPASNHNNNPNQLPQKNNLPNSGGLVNIAGANGIINNMFDSDFDMSNFLAAGDTTQSQHHDQTQQQGFVLPANWNSTGLTPGAQHSGPHTDGDVSAGDMMGMTDADWNQVLASSSSYPAWDPNGAQQDQNMMDGFRTNG